MTPYEPASLHAIENGTDRVHALLMETVAPLHEEIAGLRANIADLESALAKSNTITQSYPQDTASPHRRVAQEKSVLPNGSSEGLGNTVQKEMTRYQGARKEAAELKVQLALSRQEIAFLRESERARSAQRAEVDVEAADKARARDDSPFVLTIVQLRSHLALADKQLHQAKHEESLALQREQGALRLVAEADRVRIDLVEALNQRNEDLSCLKEAFKILLGAASVQLGVLYSRPQTRFSYTEDARKSIVGMLNNLTLDPSAPMFAYSTSDPLESNRSEIAPEFLFEIFSFRIGRLQKAYRRSIQERDEYWRRLSVAPIS